MVERVRKTIQSEGMLLPGDTVVVGVSGGPDSVCLLNLLTRLRGELDLNVLAAHLEHGLRGEDSLEDAAFVRRMCASLDVPCTVRHLDIGALAAASGRSCEEQGRLERYQLFDEVLKEAGGGKIAVAHNRDDQAETLLLNLARGSGLHGLCGMRPVRGNIIRPLLFTGRDEIEAWLLAEGISWRVDASNAGNDYARNRARNIILPEMKEHLNSRAPEHLAAAAAYLQEADDYLAGCAERFLEEHAVRRASPREIGVPASALADAPGAVRHAVLCRMAAWAQEKEDAVDLSAVHYGLMEEACALPPGRGFDLGGGLRARREGDLMVIGPSGRDAAPREEETPPDPVFIREAGRYRFGELSFEADFITPREAGDYTRQKQCTKYISCDTIQNAVCIRRGRAQDRITIDSLGHTVSLKEHLKKAKVPARERERAAVLADGERILWVVGGRIGEDAKVTGDTGKVLRITHLRPDEEESR